MKYSFCNGITLQVRWLNGLWVEFYFNKVGEKLGDTQKNVIQ